MLLDSVKYRLDMCLQMDMKKASIIAILASIILLVFIFAPILYDFSSTYPAGMNVTHYQSPSCMLFGFGTQYAFGHGLPLQGQPNANKVNSYEFYWNNCNVLPPS
jgi:hypothetical protein